MPTPEEEMRQLREALAALGEVGAAPQAELEAIREAAARDRRRWHLSLTFLIVGGPLLFALTLFLTFRQVANAAGERNILRDGVSCILADLDEHRLQNAKAHEALAGGIAQPRTVPPEPSPLLTPEQAEQFRQRCKTFVESRAGVGPRGGGPN